MTVQLECRENFPGVKLLHHNKDIVVAFTGEATLRNLPYLMEAGATFAHRNLGWSEQNASDILTKALKVDNLSMGLDLNDQTISLIMKDTSSAKRIPSVLFFRDENSKPGNYVGYVAERMFFLQTEHSEPGRIQGEEVPLMYQLLRAIEQAGRGRNRARSSIELALLLHPEARWFFHRTGNYIAAYTNTQSIVLDQEQSRPWGLSFASNPFARELIRKGFNIVKGNGRKIDDNGVVRDDYPEPNLGVEPLRSNAKPEVVAIHNKMYGNKEGEFAMGPKDSVYPLYRVA